MSPSPPELAKGFFLVIPIDLYQAANELTLLGMTFNSLAVRRHKPPPRRLPWGCQVPARSRAKDSLKCSFLCGFEDSTDHAISADDVKVPVAKMELTLLFASITVSEHYS